MRWRIWEFFSPSATKKLEQSLAPAPEEAKPKYTPSRQPVSPTPVKRSVVELKKPTILSRKQRQKQARRQRRRGGAPLPLVKVTVSILSEKDIDALLAIEDSVPPKLNLNIGCVKAIIRWFLRQDCIEGNYKQFPLLQASIVGKKFRSDDFIDASSWLYGIGVILIHRGHRDRGEILISLRGRPESAPCPEAESIVRIAMSVKRELDKLPAR